MHITVHITGITVVDNSERDILDTILIKVASRCNINCSYCYVFNMGDTGFQRQEKLMTEETLAAVCRELKRIQEIQKEVFSIVLHGGEPLLLGAKRLRVFLAALRNAVPPEYPIGIQTNGILISDEILDVCSAYRVSLAISIDGPEKIHDSDRVGFGSEGTHAQVIKGYELLRKHQDALFLNAGLLAVVDPQSDPEAVYHFFKTVEAPSVDFLYKDGNHSKMPKGKRTAETTEYGDWMIGLLKVYLQDPKPIPIRVLDDMMKVMIGGMVSKEGLGLNNFGILIIDTDGTLMKNDTLKSVYNGADRFEKTSNIKKIDLVSFIQSEEFRDYREMQRPTCQQCHDCAALNICGGGMLLHRWHESNGFDNPSIYCQDQLTLINNMQIALNNILNYAAEKSMARLFEPRV